jgi:tetratricopeptide (TPR) repeat protein
MPISLTKNTTTKGEYYPPQLLSQKLNNRAGFLITMGNYVEGIALLTKALKLVKNNMGDSSSRAHQSNCRSCSLQSCLIMEHDSLMMDQSQHYQEQEGQQQQEQQQEHQAHYIKNTSIIINSNSDEMGCDNQPQRAAASQKHLSHHHNPHDTLDDNDNGFVYRRPILVNKQCIEEMHDMGITLSLIIVFNLALAHHLKAIETSSSSSSSSSSTTMNCNSLKALQQALQLYELAYQLHCDYIQQSESETERSYNSNNNNNNDQYDRSIGSLRFTMIVSNNLGEIHRAAGDTEKHTMCLQHLLSTIMYMVDSNLGVLDSKTMDGFFSNVSPVVGLSDKDMYAQAA